MSHYGLKINKSESPDKTPYTIYYPHLTPSSERKWTQPWYQVVSIDPARKNYALRIERRYNNGWITPVVFDKVHIESIEQDDHATICNTYQTLTAFLNKYEQFYDQCHFIIIERQLPQNYKATRIAQHTISYFCLKLANKPLLSAIIELDPKIKGKLLNAPKNISDKQLKSWAIEKARELLTIRLDDFSLQVLNCFKNKQDDLADTVCQIEALFKLWGLPQTAPPPPLPLSLLDTSTPVNPAPITYQLLPNVTILDHPDIEKSKQPSANTSAKYNQHALLSLLQSAPTSTPTNILTQTLTHTNTSNQTLILNIPFNNQVKEGQLLNLTNSRLNRGFDNKLVSNQGGKTARISLNLVSESRQNTGLNIRTNI